ncbi:MAG TPA: glycosyltransferase family A protein [Candidatus Acidoferrum sp.]|jgi:biofilm PGA synthesis N-glycosyltransferase PgaC|nr:glycosyltransferase family A protein [Candidatus Acidoferrum sp.]
MESRKAELCRYVLITPARDEAAFVEQTIQSVVAQTIRPVRWVVVSDGSTDGTDHIVQRCADRHSWISLVRMPERRGRHFAGKVHAFNAGYAAIKSLDYEFIGNLDGDTAFPPDYFEYLLGNFARDPRLGLAGTNYFEASPKYDVQLTNAEDVPGICQLFRRECFEGIGGYQPVEAGGVDLIAVLSARMQGWKTRIFPDRFVLHLRPQGTANSRPLMVHFVHGEHDYRFGGHPLWELFRVAYRITQRPFVVGGCLLGLGFIWALLSRMERAVPIDLIRFRRNEQIGRLGRFFRQRLPRAVNRDYGSLLLVACCYICADCSDLFVAT